MRQMVKTQAQALYKRSKIARLLLLAFLFPPFSASAVYVEVKVSQTGRDASEARDLALADGQRSALRQLAQERDPSHVERQMRAVNDSKLSQMVRGYEVLEEAMSPTSYRASLRYEFDDKQVNALLGKAPDAPPPGAGGLAGKPFAPPERNVSKSEEEEPTSVTLVLPVLKTASGLLLWEKDNAWRDAVNAAVLENGKGVAVAAYGDPSDKLLLKPVQALQADGKVLAPLAKRYAADVVLVATATPPASMGDNPLEMELTLRSIAAAQSKPVVLKFQATEGEDAAALQQRAARQLVIALAKKAQENDYAAKAPVQSVADAAFPLYYPTDWPVLQQRLAAIPALSAVEVTQANWKNMQIRLHFSGEASTLPRLLATQRVSARERPGQPGFFDLGLR